jgi:hypothetical protein
MGKKKSPRRGKEAKPKPKANLPTTDEAGTISNDMIGWMEGQLNSSFRVDFWHRKGNGATIAALVDFFIEPERQGKFIAFLYEIMQDDFSADCFYFVERAFRQQMKILDVMEGSNNSTSSRKRLRFSRSDGSGSMTSLRRKANQRSRLQT